MKKKAVDAPLNLPFLMISFSSPRLKGAFATIFKILLQKGNLSICREKKRTSFKNFYIFITMFRPSAGDFVTGTRLLTVNSKGRRGCTLATAIRVTLRTGPSACGVSLRMYGYRARLILAGVATSVMLVALSFTVALTVITPWIWRWPELRRATRMVVMPSI